MLKFQRVWQTEAHTKVEDTVKRIAALGETGASELIQSQIARMKDLIDKGCAEEYSHDLHVFNMVLRSIEDGRSKSLKVV